MRIEEIAQRLQPHGIRIDGVEFAMTAEQFMAVYPTVLIAKAEGVTKMLNIQVGDESTAVVFVGPHTAVQIVTTPEVAEMVGIERQSTKRLDDL